MLIRVNYDSTTWRQILEQMELLSEEEQQVRKALSYTLHTMLL